MVEFIKRAIMHSKNGKFLYFLRSRVPGECPTGSGDDSCSVFSCWRVLETAWFSFCLLHPSAAWLVQKKAAPSASYLATKAQLPSLPQSWSCFAENPPRALQLPNSPFAETHLGLPRGEALTGVWEHFQEELNGSLE